MGPESYVLREVFSQAFMRYGLFAGVFVLGLFAFVGVISYYAKAKVDMMRTEATVRESERQQEALGRQREEANRESERASLIRELSETRAQVNKFLTNHLEHLRGESEKHQSVLGDISKCQQEQVIALRAITDSLNDHREEESKRAANIYERFENIKDVLRG